MSINLKTDRMKAKIDNGIGWMIFNNPSRHNALSLVMWQAMGDILEEYNDAVSYTHLTLPTKRIV